MFQTLNRLCVQWFFLHQRDFQSLMYWNFCKKICYKTLESSTLNRYHSAFWIIHSNEITFEFAMHALFLFPVIWLECPLICTLCPTYPNLTAIFTLLFNAPSLGQWVTWIKGRQSGLMLSNATQEFEWENLKSTLENVWFIMRHWFKQVLNAILNKFNWHILQ